MASYHYYIKKEPAIIFSGILQRAHYDTVIAFYVRGGW